MSHQHQHTASSGTALKITLGVTTLIAALEVIGGILSGSLALLGDAAHMLVDILALVLALFAAQMARRPITPERTYGYHRIEILAALANGSFLVAVSIYIFFSAYERIFAPPEIDVPLMLIIATAGLLANVTGVIVLGRTSRRSLNVKAAFWHILGDAMSSVGVILAGIIIAVTGNPIADPVIAIIIGLIILWGAGRVVFQSVDILMEKVPSSIKTGKVINSIKNIEGVKDIHDIHIWTITSGINALSAHLMINDQAVSLTSRIIDSVTRMLAEDYDIRHTTLQLECEHCPSSCVCDLTQKVTFPVTDVAEAGHKHV